MDDLGATNAGFTEATDAAADAGRGNVKLIEFLTGKGFLSDDKYKRFRDENKDATMSGLSEFTSDEFVRELQAWEVRPLVCGSIVRAVIDDGRFTFKAAAGPSERAAPAAPASAAPVGIICVFQCLFESNVQTTWGARRKVHDVLTTCKALVPRAGDKLFVWYGDADVQPNAAQGEDEVDVDGAASGNASLALHVKVYCESHLDLEAAFSEIHRNFQALPKCKIFHKYSSYSDEGLRGLVDLRRAILDDYDHQRYPSACDRQSDRGSASVRSVAASYFSEETDSFVLKYQAITWFDVKAMPAEKLHLIPKWIVDNPKMLENFTDAFWLFAKQKYNVTKEEVLNLLGQHPAHYDLNKAEVNLLGATNGFHVIFDGLRGDKIRLPGSQGERSKMRKVELGGSIYVVVHSSNADVTPGKMDAGASEREKRDTVKLHIAFSDAHVYKIQVRDITESEVASSTDGWIVLTKDVHVFNSRDFLTALNFKATMN